MNHFMVGSDGVDYIKWNVQAMHFVITAGSRQMMNRSDSCKLEAHIKRESNIQSIVSYADEDTTLQMNELTVVNVLRTWQTK